MVDRKITFNVKRWEYFLNPLIAGGKNESNRRDLTKKYSTLLKEKKKNAFLDLYPVYSKKQSRLPKVLASTERICSP